MSISLAILFKKLVTLKKLVSGSRLSSIDQEHTGLTNHLAPPNSNQPRWPPHDVVNMTPYGVWVISW
jgi:hypothetical protein